MTLIRNFKGRFTSILATAVLLAGFGSVIAQDSPKDEHEEWQKAKREASREHREYLNNPKKGNYLDWRSAQRDANREHEEYLLAMEVSRRYPKGTRTWVVADSDARDEYDEWRSAQREAVRERQEYARNPTADNYEGWKDAQADERREYAEYRYATGSSPVTYRNASYRTYTVKKRPVSTKAKRKTTTKCRCS